MTKRNITDLDFGWATKPSVNYAVSKERNLRVQNNIDALTAALRMRKYLANSRLKLSLESSLLWLITLYIRGAEADFRCSVGSHCRSDLETRYPARFAPPKTTSCASFLINPQTSFEAEATPYDNKNPFSTFLFGCPNGMARWECLSTTGNSQI